MHGRVLTGIAIAVVITAVITGNALLVKLAYVLCAVLVAAGGLTVNAVRWLDVTRRTRARRAQVGGLAEETLTIRNSGWLPKLWLEARDYSELPAHRVSRVISTLGPGQARTWSVRTLCRRRGVFRLGPMVLTGGDPLGLFQMQRVLPETAPFVVFPRTVPLRGMVVPSGYLAGGREVRQRAQFATTSVRSVRQYQPGDAFNRIHWPTTARRQRLYTKEFELDPFADFWILLDLDRTMHVGRPVDAAADDEVLPWLNDSVFELESTTEEYAITAAASLARHFVDRGESVGLIAYGQRRIIVQPDRGERQLNKLLGNLAVLRAVGGAGLSEVLSTESHEFTRHTTLIVVTPATSTRWVGGLRELRHRGVSSLVVLIEAATFGTAGSNLGLRRALQAQDIPTRQVRCGEDLGAALGG